MRVIPFSAIVLTTGLTMAAGGFAWSGEAKDDEAAGADKPAAKQPERKSDKKAGGGPIDPEMILRKFDANGDGKLGKDEAPEQMSGGFGKIDADGDGFVTREELKIGLD
ncbi:MAG: hypothetical protein ACRDD1_17720, partial [Planctomycetia bacterium]